MVIFRYGIAMVLMCLAGGCATAPAQQYWFSPKRTLQQTSADLFACRQVARTTSDNQMYSALEMEAPCMTAKGYMLVTGVPQYPVN